MRLDADLPAPLRAACDTAPTAGADSGRGGPRLLFFDVTSRRDLAQRAAAATPGARFASRRAWTEDPGEPRRTLRRGDVTVGLWYWRGSREEFEAQATEILLRLVHPLVARALPFCLGLPFAADVLEPPRLAVGEAARLDLEDIGRLLRASAAGTRTPSRPVRRRWS